MRVAARTAETREQTAKSPSDNKVIHQTANTNTSPGLQFRIVAFYSLLLSGILAITFLVVTLASYQIAQNQMREELVVGRRVFMQLLDQQQQQLLQSATVLTADFGLLEALSVSDAATLRSALLNHSGRIEADLMVLFDLELHVRADTLKSSDHPDNNSLIGMIGSGENFTAVTDVVKSNGKLYQVVVVPVLAPEPIAWIAMGFLIDEQLAARLKAITGLDVSFVADQQLLVSTLDSGLRAEVEAEVQRLPGHVRLSGVVREVAGFSTLIHRVSGSPYSEDLVVLQRSPTEAMAQFVPVRITLATLSFGALVLTIFGSVLIARRIIRPINNLAVAADLIQNGNYELEIEIEDIDEIGRLGASLQHMVSAIADREAKIKRLAFEDPSTGLPNRALFVRELDQFIKVCRRGGMTFSVVFLEVDRFKQINETLGYDAGDAVLRYVADLLPECVRESDIVACLGGELFAILLAMNTAEYVNSVTGRIEATSLRPYYFCDQPVDVSFSVGIAHYPEHATDAESLLRKSDVALEKAKRDRLGIAVYHAEHEQRHQDHLHLSGELREAVDKNQFCLYFQPKLHLQSQCVTAVESLIRWQHPVKGMIPPDHFIPFAEHTGAIRMLTAWVIEAATQQVRQWQARGLTVQVSINVSARDLLNPELPTIVERAVVKNRIRAESLCIEITESALMEDPATALATVTQLAGLGISLSIDDYGTGYSSLAYLKNLPVAELKIDREFISNMNDRPEDRAIVRSTIELAHDLNLEVVAEGVENESVINELHALGCDLVQGYFIAKPMPASEFEGWLAQNYKPARQVLL